MRLPWTLNRSVDNVQSQNQQGAGNDYMHNAVPRKFLFPAGGQKLMVNKDMAFTVKLPAVELKDEWNKNNLKAVVFVTGIMDKDDKNYSHREVFASDNVAYTVSTSSQEIANHKLEVSVVKNRILVSGDCDNFQVFDMLGHIVATDAQTTINPGVYVVRAKNVYGVYTYKVEIK